MSFTIRGVKQKQGEKRISAFQTPMFSLLNPLSSNTVQFLTSPHIFTAYADFKARRIKEMITKDKII